MSKEEKNKTIINKAYQDFLAIKHGASINQMALERLILLVVGGSRSYGTFTDISDTDLRGIFIATKPYYLGLKTIEQVEIKRVNSDEEKDTLFELKKFCFLAMNANPNIIELLFTKPEHILFSNPMGNLLIKNRDLFLSKKCAYSFSGYAFSQLKRIQAHFKWIKNPPTEPQEIDFTNVPKYRNKITRKEIPITDFESKMKKIRAIQEYLPNQQSRDEDLFEKAENWDLINVLNKDAFHKAMDEWNQYNTWKKNRNRTRSLLEQRYHYDVKHAIHLVRLLCQCKQILKTGTFCTYLNEKDLELINLVWNGGMTFEELLVFADKANAEIELLKQNSKLPHNPNVNKINELLVSIVEQSI